MRTTIDVREDLLRRARQLALDRGATLGDVVNDGLCLLLDHLATVPAPSLPRGRPSALRPGVDLSPRTIKELLAEDEA